MSLQRILYVANEIAPFLDTSLVANCMRSLPEAMQHKQIDVRMMVPKFGVINDRMNKLHEVLRLSGKEITIEETSHSIIVKVSTIPNTRLQVYFIDNPNFFGCRKAIFTDIQDIFFEDNDLRMIFFCIGIIETLQKLDWKPDIVHCHGWITSLLPLFGKKHYHSFLSETKIITTLYNTTFSNHFPFLSKRLKNLGILDIPESIQGSFQNIIELAMLHSDLVLRGEELNAAEFENLSTAQSLLLVQNDAQYHATHWSLYHELFTQ